VLTAVGDRAGQQMDTAGPPARSARRRPGSPVAAWNALLAPAGVVVTAALGWQQRWIADDGLIVLRTVRHLLAGNGPVFNAGERLEVNTSTAWTAMVTLAGLVPAVRLDWAAVGLGLVCAAAGVGLGMDAARRLHVGGTVLLPLGAAVLLALKPMRDFITSGLETGLVTLWLAASWWLLVRVVRRDPARRGGQWPWAAAFVLGLGPLVRPDLGLFSVLGLALLVALLRPGWRSLLGLGLVAGALPVVYEIFRAGYYGLLVPSTALAKEASQARWDQGLVYLHDTVATYWLWVPLGCLLLALGALVGRRRGGWSDRWGTLAVTLLPVAAGIAMAAYVTRVGGDFMHGRMLLPAITAVLLPLLVVPATRGTALPAAGVAVWFGLAVTGLGVSYAERPSNVGGIVDERAFWSRAVGSDHPISAADFIQGTPLVRRSVPAVQQVDEPALLLIEARPGPNGWRPYPSRDGVDQSTIPFLNLGMMGAAQPLDVRVTDTVGLANPLARHATPVFGGRIGHDKDLPTAWFVADEVRRDAPVPIERTAVLDARRAVQCPAIAEMLDSVRAPLTPQRFWDNLTGAVERTGFRYSRLPALAADDCGSSGAGGADRADRLVRTGAAGGASPEASGASVGRWPSGGPDPSSAVPAGCAGSCGSLP